MKKVLVALTFLLLLFTSCPDATEGTKIIASVDKAVRVEGVKGLELAEVSLTITLERGAFVAMSKATTPVSSWFTPSFPQGLSIELKDDVNEGDTSLTLIFKGKSQSENYNTISIEIPYQFFINAEKSKPKITVDTKGSSFHIIKKTIASLLDRVSIMGSTDSTLDGSDEFTILLEADSFRSDLKTDVTSWFSPVISGLKYTVTERTSPTSIKVAVSGTPGHDVATTPLSIVIGQDATLNAIRTKLTSEQMKGSTITVENATLYNYKWELYDLASIVDPLSSEVVLSENHTLTLQRDGSPLSYKNENIALINSGEGKEVSLDNNGLSRHGYRFSYWTKNPVLKSRDYESDRDDLSFNLSVNDGYKEGDAEKIVKLYAVYDTSNAYYVKSDLSNGGTSLPGTYQKPLDDSSHIGYNYYNEIAIPSEGYAVPHTISDSSVQKVILEHDFAIAEHPITGYMLDEIREWAGVRGYEIPLETKVIPSANDNTVGYGSKNTGGITEPLGDASHPITFVTVPQAMVIANALTAYYNAHKTSGEFLSPAYMVDENDSDTEVKTIDDAKALVATTGRLLAISGNRGFRLPLDAEWDFAARVVGKSDYDSSFNMVSDAFKGSVYPMFQQSKTIPGKNEGDTDTPNPDDYSWYRLNSEVSSNEYHTLGFSSLSLDEDVPYGRTLMSKYKASSGVRNMSGNIKEWTVPSNPDENIYKVRGGSFLSPQDEVTIKSFTLLSSPDERNGEYGIRLVRSTS